MSDKVEATTPETDELSIKIPPDITGVPVHELSSIYPVMTDEEYGVFLADVVNHGAVITPIVLFEGMILDGRHRAKAVADAWNAGHEIAYDTREFNPDTEGDPSAFVAAMNGARRHLNASQKAMIGLKFYDRFAAEAAMATGKKRKLSEAALGASNERAAKLTGCSAKYIQIAAQVRAHDPALAEKVLSGEVTLTKAAKGLAATSTGAGTGDKATVTKAEPTTTGATSNTSAAPATSSAPGRKADPVNALPWQTAHSAWITDLPDSTGVYRVEIEEIVHPNGMVVFDVECYWSETGVVGEDGTAQHTMETLEKFDSFNETGKVSAAKKAGYEACVKHAKDNAPIVV